jgi:hypothetical protein
LSNMPKISNLPSGVDKRYAIGPPAKRREGLIGEIWALQILVWSCFGELGLTGAKCMISAISDAQPSGAVQGSFMRGVRLFCGVGCFVLLCHMLTPALGAQVVEGQGIPPGSYIQTCTVTSFVAATHVLAADCEPFPGAHRISNLLTVSQCAGEIRNHGGYLQCPALPGTWGYGGAIPDGDYQQSCVAMQVTTPAFSRSRHYELSASCEKVDVATSYSGPFHLQKTTTITKHSVWTVIDLANCQIGAYIRNVAGQLQCLAGTKR